MSSSVLRPSNKVRKNLKPFQGLGKTWKTVPLPGMDRHAVDTACTKNIIIISNIQCIEICPMGPLVFSYILIWRSGHPSFGSWGTIQDQQNYKKKNKNIEFWVGEVEKELQVYYRITSSRIDCFCVQPNDEPYQKLGFLSVVLNDCVCLLDPNWEQVPEKWGK